MITGGGKAGEVAPLFAVVTLWVLRVAKLCWVLCLCLRRALGPVRGIALAM